MEDEAEALAGTIGTFNPVTQRFQFFPWDVVEIVEHPAMEIAVLEVHFLEHSLRIVAPNHYPVWSAKMSYEVQRYLASTLN